MDQESGYPQPWISVKDAASLFGIGFATIKNSISRGAFPVPTYKVGRLRVIDRDVLTKYFDGKKAEGLAQLLEKAPSVAAARSAVVRARASVSPIRPARGKPQARK